MFLEKVQSSPTLEMVNTVLEKQARGEKVVSLAIGEPAFDTPTDIIEAAYKSMKKGDTHYVSSYGVPEVRKAIVSKVRRKNGIQAELANSIFITTKLSIFAALLACAEPGFEALLPDPGYFYGEPVLLLGGKPVYYCHDTNFSIDLDDVKKKAGPKTKVVVLNTPSNPTGRVLDRSALKELYDFCADRRIRIVSDEAYEDIVFGKKHMSVGSLEKKPDVVVSLFSLSKSYAMTGWRAGYAIADEKVIFKMYKFIENTFSCFPPFIQAAAAHALENGDQSIGRFATEYRERRKLLLDEMSRIDGLEPNEIEGTFYAFPKFSIKMPATTFAKTLLQEQNVAVLPGTSFGASGEGRVRISFSVSNDVVKEGMGRVRRFFEGRR
ncbi:MAG: aminotransferase class I/II-fold pyridoxal phosphate-dependent enzyme [Nitrososphaerota archaeon]|nr:aminotransferase class I/II-fold pyridoxal phosphate-dependent enzyme [Nitrososphaerota archaeon]